VSPLVTAHRRRRGEDSKVSEHQTTRGNSTARMLNDVGQRAHGPLFNGGARATPLPLPEAAGLPRCEGRPSALGEFPRAAVISKQERSVRREPGARDVQLGADLPKRLQALVEIPRRQSRLSKAGVAPQRTIKSCTRIMKVRTGPVGATMVERVIVGVRGASGAPGSLQSPEGLLRTQPCQVSSEYAQNRQGNKIESPMTPVCELIPRFGLSVFAFEMCWSRYPA
jgi:hypothetical protein